MTREFRISSAFPSWTMAGRVALVGLAIALIANVSCSREKSAARGGKAIAPVADAADKGWPRVYTLDGNEITLQQPQIDA